MNAKRKYTRLNVMLCLSGTLVAGALSTNDGNAQQAQQGQGQVYYSSGNAYNQAQANQFYQQTGQTNQKVYNNQAAWEQANGVTYGKNGLPARTPYSSRYCRNLNKQDAINMYKQGAKNQFGGPAQQYQPQNTGTYYIPGSNAGSGSGTSTSSSGGVATYGNGYGGQPYYTQAK